MRYYLTFYDNLGSPPRMRGKPTINVQNANFTRITPADAGKTYAAAACTISHEDHPRGCGENSPMPMFADNAAGSPPRMRGKRFASYSPTLPYRITPADAGKTLSHFQRRL